MYVKVHSCTFSEYCFPSPHVPLKVPHPTNSVSSTPLPLLVVGLHQQWVPTSNTRRKEYSSVKCTLVSRLFPTYQIVWVARKTPALHHHHTNTTVQQLLFWDPFESNNCKQNQHSTEWTQVNHCCLSPIDAPGRTARLAKSTDQYLQRHPTAHAAEWMSDTFALYFGTFFWKNVEATESGTTWQLWHDLFHTTHSNGRSLFWWFSMQYIFRSKRAVVVGGTACRAGRLRRRAILGGAVLQWYEWGGAAWWLCAVVQELKRESEWRQFYFTAQHRHPPRWTSHWGMCGLNGHRFHRSLQ